MSVSFLEVPGGRLAYEVSGPETGSLVVLAHGMGVDRRSYRLLAPKLAAAGYRVATIDLRGHGESSTGWPAYDAATIGDDLLALVRGLGGPAVLVGNSIAAASVTFAAAKAPADVTGIVLVGAFVHQEKPNAVMRVIQNAVLHSPRLWTMYLASLYPGPKPADFVADQARLRRVLGEPGRMLAVRRVLDPTPEPWPVRAASVRCPVLVVMGTRDKDFKDPRREAEDAVAAFEGHAPSVRLLLVENSGHYPFADQPEETSREILAFLTQTVHA